MARLKLLKKMCRQVAVYWTPLVKNEYGQETYSAPDCIKVRWEDTDTEYTDNEGRKANSPSVVYSQEDLEESGVLWLGDIDELVDVTGTDPFVNDDAWRIVKVERIPSMSAKDFLKIYYLGKR